MPESDLKLESRMVRLETQLGNLIKKMDEVLQELKVIAITMNEVNHLKAEQILQWQKIDAHKLEHKKEFERLAGRIDNHLGNCPGMTRANEIVNEAKEIALKALEKSSNLSGLPGKWAIAIVGGLLLLFSNVAGGLVLWFLTH